MRTLCIFFFVVLNGTAPVSGTRCMRITATPIDRGHQDISSTRSLCAGVDVRRRRWMDGAQSGVRATAVRGRVKSWDTKRRFIFAATVVVDPYIYIYIIYMIYYLYFR